MSVEENKRLMKTLDDGWNSQDWARLTAGTQKRLLFTGRASQSPREGSICTKKRLSSSSRRSPTTTLGAIHIVLFGEGDWTCSVAKFTGTMTGPMPGPDGTTTEPTNKSFEVAGYAAASLGEGAGPMTGHGSSAAG